MTHLDTSNTSYGQKKGWELGIAPISLRVSGVQHTIGKLLKTATTLLQTSFQSEVCTQSCRSPNFGNFENLI